MKSAKIKSIVAAAIALTACAVSAAPVVTSTTNFNLFTNGSVNGQGGWGVSNPAYVQQVVDLGGGNKAWQLANQVVAAGFGDNPFSPRPGGIPVTTLGVVTDPTPISSFFAGETSTGADYSRFIASYDFRSVSASHDPGAVMTISPDSGEGGRQGWIRLTSNATGVSVETLQYLTNGTFTITTSMANLAFAQWNTIRYEIDFFDGADNDVARIFLNNSLVATVGSWENFFDVFQPALHPNRVAVQSLIFRPGAAAPNAQGFYFDNVVTMVDNRRAVPEPGSLALAGLALGGLVVASRRRRS